eukprot:3941138-Rhodomonas_salina.2
MLLPYAPTTHTRVLRDRWTLEQPMLLRGSLYLCSLCSYAVACTEREYDPTRQLVLREYDPTR